MSQYLNIYGRNELTLGDPDTRIWGFTYLGPIRIPPIPTTIGMADRNTGIIWFLMWDGAAHLVLTNQPPQPFAQWQGSNWGITKPYGQNTIIFGPWDGPYMGVTGWRLGVVTVAGVPRLQFDSPDNSAHGGYSASGPPIIAPDINGPQTQYYPESTGYPTPQPPTVPGIPSSAPVPTGGGFAAFQAAYQTNMPPLVLPALVTVGAQPQWHLQHLGDLPALFDVGRFDISLFDQPL